GTLRRGETDQLHAVGRDHDRALVRRLGRAGAAGLGIGARLDGDGVARRRRIDGGLDRLAPADGGRARAAGTSPDDEPCEKKLHGTLHRVLLSRRRGDESRSNLAPESTGQAEISASRASAERGCTPRGHGWWEKS